MSGVFNTLDIVFWGVVTFSILVLLHEGGHFLAARLFRVKVHEFMIGLPGPALRFRGKNVTWGITAIPLGGYVRIAGMEPGPEDPLLGPVLKHVAALGTADISSLARDFAIGEDRSEAIVTTLEDWGAIVETEDGVFASSPALDSTASQQDLLDAARSVTYRGLRTWKRIVVLVSGVAVNLLTAIVVFTAVLAVWGTYEPSTVLETVQTASPAADAGLLPGDMITSLDGHPIASWVDFITLMSGTDAGEAVTVGFERNGAVTTVRVLLAEREGHGFLGVGPAFRKVDYGVVAALKQSVVWTGMVFESIRDFFRPSTFSRSVENARGIVGISVMAADAAKAGPIDYAWLIALLSLSLGAMNVIPIPPLDGGKIAVELVERIAGRQLGRRFSTALSAIGAVLLFSLIGYMMYADVARLAR